MAAGALGNASNALVEERKPLFLNLPSGDELKAVNQAPLPSAAKEVPPEGKPATPPAGLAMVAVEESSKVWPSKTVSPSDAWMRLARNPEDPDAAEQMLRWHSDVEKRYSMVRKLGEGGSGEVLLVFDKLLQRQVALKRLQMKEAHFTKRFIQEIRIVSQLEHPNIVPLYDAGLDREGRAFFSMKYVEGETLEEVILRLRNGDPVSHHSYPFERRARIFLDVLHAVYFAHQHNIIHRDIKPSNIMLGRHGEVMVMDWGSAKEEADLQGTKPPSAGTFQTRAGALVGTPAYMSPEQALGKRENLDPRSDIYSLCVLFYEFLTLRHYLEHKQNVQEILFAIVSEEPIAADTIKMPLQGNPPRNLWWFIQKGLRKDPENRYASVHDMIPLLEKYLEGRIDIHCPSTLVKRLALNYAKFLDTYRASGVLIALVVFALFCIGIFQVGSWLGKT